MTYSRTWVIAALTAVLALGMTPPAVAGGDFGFGIYFGHRYPHQTGRR